MYKNIILAGGCFWCTESVFKTFKGIIDVTSGYIGGTVINPTYEQICTGTTGHAESVKVIFDTEIISLCKVLEIFFTTHDPTQYHRQGNDIGSQYRSAIFYNEVEDEKIISNAINDAKALWNSDITTELNKDGVFYEAEEYHQDYFSKNPNNAYCMAIIKPKLDKINSIYGSLLEFKV